VNLPSDWPRWYSSIFDTNDNTIAPPQFSQGALQFEVLVAWELQVAQTGAGKDGPPAPPPASLPVTLQIAFTQDLAAFHNPTGCRSQYKGAGPLPRISGAHHICPVSQAYTPYTWSQDLSKVVKAVTPVKALEHA
jgi:hypothetical protein